MNDDLEKLSNSTFDLLLNEIDNKENTDHIKETWSVGSACEIYSMSEQKWVYGVVKTIFSDDEGEWLSILYLNNYIKEIQRYSKYVRPINNKNNVTVRDSNDDIVNWDPILTAIRNSDMRYIKNLIASNEINVDEKNKSDENKTLLMYAIIIGNYDLVKLICDYGANVRITDSNGQDALTYAQAYGRYKITEMIFYRQLSGALGNDLKDIAMKIHEKNRQAAAIKQYDKYFLNKIKDFMINAMKNRLSFSADLMYFAWWSVINNDDKYAPAPLQSDLYKEMMATFTKILSDTSDANGWKWLKSEFITSLIWYLPRPIDDKLSKKDVIFRDKLIEFYQIYSDSPQFDVNRIGIDIKAKGIDGVIKNIEREYDVSFKEITGYDPTEESKQTETEELDDANDMESKLRKTLFYELLIRVRAETKKQSDLLLKQKVNKIQSERPNDWQQLVSYNVITQYASNARQDVCGCLKPKYTENDLSESKYPPSTHFSSQKHYDTSIYLSQLMFIGNILDRTFQKDMKTITKQISMEINEDISFRAGPVKTVVRSKTKIENDYINEDYPKSAKILDINRCSIQFSTIKSMMKFLEMFSMKVKTNKTFSIKSIIRCKNGWTVYNPSYPQYTDIKLNVLIQSPMHKEQKIIAEIQFLLQLMSKFKKVAHKLYSVERKFELVYNFRNLQDDMSSFDDVTDIYMHLVNKLDVKYFSILLKYMPDSINESCFKQFHVWKSPLICALYDETLIKFDEYLKKNYPQFYFNTIFDYITKYVKFHNEGFNDFIASICSKYWEEQKSRDDVLTAFLTRLFTVCSNDTNDENITKLISLTDSKEKSIIHSICKQGYSSALKFILFDNDHVNNTNKIELLNAKDSENKTPFHYACQHESLLNAYRVLKYLIKQNESIVNLLSNKSNGRNSLMEICLNRDILSYEILNILLSNSALNYQQKIELFSMKDDVYPYQPVLRYLFTGYDENIILILKHFSVQQILQWVLKCRFDHELWSPKNRKYVINDELVLQLLKYLINSDQTKYLLSEEKIFKILCVDQVCKRNTEASYQLIKFILFTSALNDKSKMKLLFNENEKELLSLLCPQQAGVSKIGFEFVQYFRNDIKIIQKILFHRNQKKDKMFWSTLLYYFLDVYKAYYQKVSVQQTINVIGTANILNDKQKMKLMLSDGNDNDKRRTWQSRLYQLIQVETIKFNKLKTVKQIINSMFKNHKYLLIKLL